MSVFIEAQPIDIQSLTHSERDALVVSTVIVDRVWHVLSRYGDHTWELTGGPTNVPRSKRFFNFNRFPIAFRQQMKAVMYRFIRRGRYGEKKGGINQFRHLFSELSQFLKFLERFKIKQLKDVSPLMCSIYAQECKDSLSPRGKPLTPGTILNKLSALEALFDLSQHTDDKMPAYPWPEDSAGNLAGVSKQKHGRRMLGGSTPLIPDDAFSSLFQAAWEIVQQGEFLLDLRDELDELMINLPGQHENNFDIRNTHLISRNWHNGLAEFRKRITDIRIACYIVVASLSGCRNHELTFVRSNACYMTIDNDGMEYWWMKSYSTKTDEGKTEWMIPFAAVSALRLMDRWARPYQLELIAEIDRLRDQDSNNIEITEVQSHIDAVFLGRDPKSGLKGACQIRTLSNASWNFFLKEFAKKNGIKWNFTTHQFRRTFANYAARSQFGDLRYLKEHFKHWSFDMTLGYALNEYQEMALYADIYDELEDLKEGVVAAWMENDENLTGGLGQRVMAWRGSNEVTMFKDHKSMVKTLAEGFGSLRSNGHAWCTADQGIDCIGNGGLDRTRCTGCDHSVIGRIHARIYQGMYDQLKTTLQCDDIGEAGRAYVNRSISRCVDVLRSFGHNLEEQNA